MTVVATVKYWEYKMGGTGKIQAKGETEMRILRECFDNKVWQMIDYVWKTKESKTNPRS